MFVQVIKFGGVGILATLVHVFTALAARSLLHVEVQQANLIGFALAFVVSYTGHARVTFNAPMRSGQQIYRFALVALTGFAASSATVWAVTGPMGLSFPVAMAAVAVIVPAISFVAMRMWVFTAAPKASLGLLPDLALVAAIALAVLAVFWGRLVNHDIAWFLFATRDWLAGAQLYVDIIEVNPPLAFYLTVPGLRLADLLGITDQQGHYVATSLLLAIGLVWSGRILLAAHDMATPRRLAFLFGTALAVLLPSLNGFGQRDQILVISFLPWALIEAAPRPTRRGQTLAAALFAAIGMCLKPHFVVLPLAVTILNCIETRSFRPVLAPANMVFLATGVAYVGYVWAVHPAYLLQIAPTATWVYGAYGKPVLEVVSGLGPSMGVFALLVAVAYRSGAMSREVRLFVALASGGLVTYFLQSTGFSYHKVPFLTFTAVAAFFLLLQRDRSRGVAALAGLAAAAVAVLGLQQGFYRNNAIPEITEVTDELGPIKQLMTISSHVYTGPPVAFAIGANWVSRYPANWLVPGAINRLDKTDCVSEAPICDRLREIAARNRTGNILDITRLQPDLIIVDRNSGYFDSPPFDWIAFMAEDPAWDAVFAQYHQAAVSSRFLYFMRNR
ncbi:GtrA family protein [Tabrizicola piscis]|uniref:GtrA family protein n=1 Tax=Tabrizicola piscis TaxID=2494374 RepID=A0A3S8U7E3_9RHOB|nr:GtrA family protein [Tabrizicola piscis]AZL59488.1 GtrA family protein [Tabrizicola piscis]